MSITRQSHTTSTTSAGYALYSDVWKGQTFLTGAAYPITSVKIKMYRTNNPGTITVSIRAVDGNNRPTGANLTSGTKTGTDVTTDTDGEVYEISLTSYTLSASTTYAICVSCTGVNVLNAIYPFLSTGDGYTSGKMVGSNDGGSTWFDQTPAGNDLYFVTQSPGLLSPDSHVSKKLVTASLGELWYESSSGTMAQLAASVGGINAESYALTMFELYEKVFIANGTNLKVADFGNTKITTTDIKPAGKVVPLHSDVLTGGSSGAKMVVDYIDASDGSCNVYGKRTTTATFSSGEVVTGSNANGDVSFTTSAAETAPPHFYSWTVYAADTTYGSLPTQAVLGCAWRGRACLSGDEDYIHQWYQSRQENPWDWNYVSADAQSPVSGGGDPSIPGQVGDTIVAQIPFDRDRLIYGGANSLWVLWGDAAEGGSLNSFYDEGGILGATAWCKDHQQNLYIMSTVGLLKIAANFGLPENLTELIYPDFVKDLAFDRSLHRIVMGYDRKRNGVKIVKVTIASGANTGWWYDLRAQALYPESYDSTEHGIFSMFHYESVDPDYNDLLLGCNNGYIYAENDDGTDDTLADDTAQAIDSYITFGPIKLGEENREGKINSFIGITAGGGSSGSETDSNDVDFKIWTELSAGKVVEQFSANSGQKVSGTIKAPGRFRGNQFRRSIRGMFAGIRIGNNTAGEVWGLERLLLGVNKGGKLK